ncbi:hypothetical protein [Streptomyces sp. NPDC087212]|uniref:DUF7687 domain-containing protein n=1 Tax=Streptomyces sp. NPDC087212 TaxID=3365766 RepID=UPI003818BE76
MLVDQPVTRRGKYAAEISPHEIVDILSSVGTPATAGLVGYLKSHGDVLKRVSAYWSKRREVADTLLSLMRTEEEAKSDYAGLSDQVLQSYGVQLEGYHKSSKALVNTVDAVVYRECRGAEVTVNTNPQSRAVLISDQHIWVSPRRLDGAIPDLLNPIAIWEIKEYWGKTGGGSKMSDAIYELHLVGLELRLFEDEFGVHVNHYAIIDGRDQWNSRKADLRRAVDLLYSGLLDELVVGREVLTEWPRIVSECCALASASQPTGDGEALF